MDVLYLGHPDTLDYIRTHLGNQFKVHFAVETDAVNRLIRSCDVVLDAYLQVSFPAERLAQAARLKLFVTASTGADHVDAATLARRGIPLLTMKGQDEILWNLTATAEHSWLLLLACARRVRAAMEDVLSGTWDRTRHPGIMLKGRVLGIIGCGRIGQWMGRYAEAFGMRCLGYDPYVNPWPRHVESSGLSPLLAASDFISVHVPLSDETRQLLGPREFQQMKPGVVLINTSRGGVIDEFALLAALREGRVAAAGLDVLVGEPDVIAHPLVEYARTHNNLLITPHIGGFSPDALHPVLKFSCERIVEFFRSKDWKSSPAREWP